MIFTDRTIIVRKGTSSINDTIILYRGDKDVEIRFTLNEGSPFRFGSGASPNIIEKTEAAYGQLIIKTPNDLPAIFSEVAPTNNGKIVFTITAEMIDEITEVGNYTFQIRLLDESRNSRATIPEVVNGIEIREPIATEDVSTSNEVGEATVGYALTTAATAEDTFDTQGNYNKTTWGTGDRITAAKLNKIEAGIDGVNKKVASGGTGGQGMTEEQAQQLSTAYQHSQSAHVQASDVPTKTSDLNNDSNFVNETYVTNAINNAQLGGGGTGSNNASDISITDTGSHFTSTNVEGALQEAGSQIKDIENNMQNIGKPTDEQVKNVINEAIANGDIVAGGLTSTAQTLLISILRSSVFTSDQSANITLLQSELAKGNSGSGGSETTQYVITNTLNNATTSNSAVLVDANSSYTAIIRENDGYTLDTITVTMGGTDITSTAVSGTTITISSVTGNIVITVETTATSTGGGSAELIQDGLIDYFDFRTVTENTLSDGQISILPTTGNGCFYSWGHINSQGEYGAKLASNVSYSANGTNSQTNCGTSFTWVFKSYMESAFSPLFSTTHAKASNTSKLNFTPKYNTSSSTANCAGVDVGGNREAGYQCFIMRVNGNECKLYYEGVLVKTIDGSTLTNFTSWDDKLAIGILGGKENGYVCQVAIYNRALTDVEVVETNEYLKTLEVK